MKRQSKAKPLPAELGAGRDQVTLGGKLHHRDVYEKVGADGIIETHVEHSLVERMNLGRAKDRMCECGAWIILNYKPKPHKKGCKHQ